jgi:hypothetical protein
MVISTGAEQVAAAVDARRNGGFALVALDGMGGSGKSTLAAALGGLRGAEVVHGDDFYRPMDCAERARLSPAEGYRCYFDWQRLREEVLAPLAAGLDAAYRRYDWERGEPAPNESHVVSRSGLIVVEGRLHRPPRTRPPTTTWWSTWTLLGRNPCADSANATTRGDSGCAACRIRIRTCRSARPPVRGVGGRARFSRGVRVSAGQSGRKGVSRRS